MMESPLRYNELQDDELLSKFNQLRSAIYRINGNSSEEEIRALSERIQREVNANRVLASIVNSVNSSLLDACINLSDQEMKQFHPVIKFLIRTNPSALLWETDTNIYSGKRVIYDVAGHSSY